MKQIIAVLNQKGGVGKTTTVLNVAAYAAKAGSTVLVVDMDPQGNATSGLGLDKHANPSTMYEALCAHAAPETLIKPTSTKGVFVMPANANLAAAEIDLAGEAEREFKLKKLLEGLDFDLIFIDCPPALGLLSINALTAASHVLIPVQAEYFAMEGLGQLLDTVQRVRAGINPQLELLGVVLTMYDGRTSLADQVAAELKKHFGNKLFETVIPRNIRLAEAPSFGKTILDHDKWSKGARAYKQLAKEVRRRLS